MRVILLGIYLVLFGTSLIGSFPAIAEGPGTPQRPAVYDIPSQSLATALRAYVAASGAQVLYETGLTAGRRSAPVKGMFTPDAALQALLAGSGLVGRRTDVDAITITPAPSEPVAAASPVAPDARFLGALQAGMLEALCRNAATRPGDYRMAVQLWITPDGVIQRAALLDTTGEARRDAALAGTLRGMAVGVMPPAGMWQPVTMIIGPPSPTGEDCVGR